VFFVEFQAVDTVVRLSQANPTRTHHEMVWHLHVINGMQQKGNILQKTKTKTKYTYNNCVSLQHSMGFGTTQWMDSFYPLKFPKQQRQNYRHPLANRNFHPEIFRVQPNRVCHTLYNDLLCAKRFHVTILNQLLLHANRWSTIRFHFLSHDEWSVGHDCLYNIKYTTRKQHERNTGREGGSRKKIDC
jgi:hypothetical protein